MKPQLLALVAAVAWGIGGYFEKKGLQMGNLSAPMGITLRTAVALAILSAASFPQWKTLPQAGTKPLMMMALGGGVLAGAVGMLCFYAALKGAPLGRVMPIAFMGVWLGGETIGARELIGMLLTTGGIVLLTVK
jgi:transporter family protein